MVAVYILCGIVSIVFFLYRKWSAYKYYWRNKGVPSDEPVFLAGNLLDNILKKKSRAELISDLCFKYQNEPLVGLYNLIQPALIINDPAYAELVLVKDFSTFMNRGDDIKSEERRPLDNHLFFLTGVEWRAIRTKMTPVFTTGKLKGMLEEIERIFNLTLNNIDMKKPVNVASLVEKFTLRVRASCVFGIDLSKAEKEEQFISTAKNMSKSSFFTLIQGLIAIFFHRLAKILNLSFFGAENEKYFLETLMTSLDERRKSNIIKQDFVQLLMELKQKGKIAAPIWTKEDDYLRNEDKQSIIDDIAITDDILVSHCIFFLVAGFEPLVTSLIMLVLELGKNQLILERLREEVDSVIDKHKEFSYQALKEMNFLELCIKEVLRLHVPLEETLRFCNKTYTFPNGVTVEKGTTLIIPNGKFHMDPSIFSEPDVFNPERFDNVSYPSCAYSPFGSGPRICIGMRFSLMEMKMFVAKLIHNYSLTLDSTTKLPVTLDKWYFMKKITSPIYINLSPRAH